MKTRKPLPPDLARPIPRPNGSVTESYLVHEWIRGVRLLLKHYEIDESDPHVWLLLSLALARDYVPGFQLDIRRRGGRPRKHAIRRPRQAQRATQKDLYPHILFIREIGEVQLRKGGKRVTEKGAIEAGVRHYFAELGVYQTEREIRDKSSKYAKRLSEARKFVRESSNT